MVKAGAAESWMKLMGLSMSDVFVDVAKFWECIEQHVLDTYDLYLRTPPIAKKTCRGECTAETKVSAH